jgi:hypothetical protein
VNESGYVTGIQELGSGRESGLQNLIKMLKKSLTVKGKK